MVLGDELSVDDLDILATVGGKGIDVAATVGAGADKAVIEVAGHC